MCISNNALCYPQRIAHSWYLKYNSPNSSSIYNPFYYIHFAHKQNKKRAKKCRKLPSLPFSRDILFGKTYYLFLLYLHLAHQIDARIDDRINFLEISTCVRPSINSWKVTISVNCCSWGVFFLEKRNQVKKISGYEPEKRSWPFLFL